MDSIITRCSNIYRPYEFLDKLITQMNMNAIKDLSLLINVSRVSLRAWLHAGHHF